ncbi:MAG: zinc ribbon domain-containing protein [Deltaproteobacteria bacterium]|nr:zinc ribbon domain-containing protein [Deltaproteobacteria bacterium]
MPIYEYQCSACKEEFEELVSGDAAPPCPRCGSGKTCKLMSRPCYHMAGGNGHTAPSSGGGACAGCSGGNCATCG